MRVGVATNEPWTRMEGERASGVEVELLRDFAAELGAEASFVSGTVPEMLEALKHGDLDAVVGGLTSDSPGVREQTEGGMTMPYLTTRVVVGVPPDEVPFDDPSGRRIAVGRLDATAAALREEGAVPVVVEDPSDAGVPVAAYPWELEGWGFEPTEVELHPEEHVMVVPLGENGWLVRLERFLHEHRDEAATLLREAEG